MSSADLCTRVHVIPGPGRQVRMPDRGFALLPSEGMEVSKNVYWSRRIAVGDVIESPPAATAAAPETKPATKGVKAK